MWQNDLSTHRAANEKMFVEEFTEDELCGKFTVADINRFRKFLSSVPPTTVRLKKGAVRALYELFATREVERNELLAPLLADVTANIATRKNERGQSPFPSVQSETVAALQRLCVIDTHGGLGAISVLQDHVALPGETAVQIVRLIGTGTARYFPGTNTLWPLPAMTRPYDCGTRGHRRLFR